ncbi:MerR family transcriptional regulator [Sulfobacillus harzensis]|uniref:MerR family transcriptional regulator n=1 Tax=Sulfobacillus harzensis TaxID=2729629 RepID=A0A7Y0L5Z8_9FIRM|nr:MerR family transcriptional regulator [Sulfobacillus harzensis]NMP23922.1 MerR family transcriptional regulator [Sulfobacillus harzensis]
MRTGEYPIGEVKERTGLTERRIRYYESLNLIRPRRSEGNQRLYSERDIERLLEIKRLLDGGLSLRAIRNQMVQPSADEVERDAESYFEGKRIAHGARPHQASLYPLKDRAAIIRRLLRDQDREDGE